jgi:high affinity Mn2+ porin
MAKIRVNLLWRWRMPRKLVVLLVMVPISATYACGQISSQQPQENNVDYDPNASLFPHSNSTRYWISGQDNIIFQWHPSFPAKYSGPNSLRDSAEHATSNVATLYLGYQVRSNTEVFFDLETAGGGGLSDALGLAGVTNVDVVRNPTLGSKPYIARIMLREIIPLGTEMKESDRDQFNLATQIPVRRIEIRAGKYGMADYFDLNEVGSDSHSQFMNWTAVNNGAYDYAADTRGYTYGVLAEYDDRNWTFKFGESLMPKVANGQDLQWNLSKAHAENFEWTYMPKLLAHRESAVRLLSYVNHANMGVYRDAVDNFLDGATPTPEITAHTARTTTKYGFTASVEQDLPHDFRAFARWGWNEGQHESFAYTEADATIEAGGDLAGKRWHRKLDKVGSAFISNGISADHQEYLRLGGLGFLLGDGNLNYAREDIWESYYNAHIWRGIFAAFDIQSIHHPGYNQDRGSVLAPGFRFHLEL